MSWGCCMADNFVTGLGRLSRFSRNSILQISTVNPLGVVNPVKLRKWLRNQQECRLTGCGGMGKLTACRPLNR